MRKLYIKQWTFQRFFRSIFNSAVSTETRHHMTVWHLWMKNWKWFGRKMSWPNQGTSPATCLERLLKTAKTSVRLHSVLAKIQTKLTPKFMSWVLSLHQPAQNTIYIWIPALIKNMITASTWNQKQGHSLLSCDSTYGIKIILLPPQFYCFSQFRGAPPLSKKMTAWCLMQHNL